MSRRLVCLVALILAACQPSAVPPAPDAPSAPNATDTTAVPTTTRSPTDLAIWAAIASEAADLGVSSRRSHPIVPPLRAAQRCFPTDSLAGPPRPLEALTERAADLMEAGRYPEALVCAEEAARVDGRSIIAHRDRALCLAQLNRLEEAEAALLRALALDPDGPETLALAADHYVTTFAPSADHSEIGLELARRAQKKLAKKPKGGKGSKRDKELLGWALVSEGLALTDLGRAREAVLRLDQACKLLPHDVDAIYARGVALYELSRFDEALRALTDVTVQKQDDAAAWHHLGLVKERLGDAKGADHAFAQAEKLAPSDFPPLLPVDAATFKKLVDDAVLALPANLRSDLTRAELQTAELPDQADLTAEEPPLSPTILGLYRGLPLQDYVDRESRTIVLYRKNLLRAVRTLQELKEQIRTTLLHELGHLRGEDDETLRSRGLE